VLPQSFAIGLVFASLLVGAAPLASEELTGSELATTTEQSPVASPIAPQESELKALAEELGLAAAGEAALLVFSLQSFDFIRVGTRLLGPGPSDPDGAVRQLVTGLREGVAAVEVVAGSSSWEGQVQLIDGSVALLELGQVLPQVPMVQSQPDASVAFDLFEFYDQLDARGALKTKLEYCAIVLAGDLAGPDRSLVEQACARFERKVEDERLREEELKRLVENPDELVLGLSDGEGAEQPDFSAQPMLYRPDGTVRSRPRGTLARTLVGVSAFVAGGAGLGGALYWELRAQQEYLAFRKAEQFGEDTAMTAHFHYTQEHDRSRNAALGMAGAAITGGVVAVILQKLAAKRFAAAKAAVRGPVDREAAAP
tara:strand:- start:1502 stop:2608 length:1107 start_codon:yes stop_codon:yes gene_type:complete